MKQLIAFFFIGTLIVFPAHAQTSSSQQSAQPEQNGLKGAGNNGNPFALQPLQQGKDNKSQAVKPQNSAASATPAVDPDADYCHQLKDGSIHCHENRNRTRNLSSSEARRQRIEARKQTNAQNPGRKNSTQAPRSNNGVYKLIIQQK